MIIKTLEITDLVQFYPLFQEIILNNFSYYHPKICQYFLGKIYHFENLKYYLETNQKTIFVAEIDQKLVGFSP